MREHMPKTAESLGVTFRELEPAEVVSVRRHVGTPDEMYMGRLIRTTPSGPVWADEDLQRHIGDSLTTEDNAPMHVAKAQCLSLIALNDAQRVGRGRGEGGKASFDFHGGLPDKPTWLRLWDALHSTGDSAIVRVGDT